MASETPASRLDWRMVLPGPRALTVVLFLLFWISVANHWTVKSWSDPMNYLTYAEDLSDQFSKSKWPALFPAVLAGLLPVVGKYNIFLFNLIPVSLLLWVAGRLAVRCASEWMEKERAAWALPLTVMLLIQFDPSLWMTLINPYRDPLAMLLLLLAVTNYLAYFQESGYPASRICLAGVCLGLAVSVREPNVLVVLPMMALGAYRLFVKGPVPLWRTVGWFIACFLGGVAILLVQNYLYSGNALVPTQSAAQEEVVPGMKGDLVGAILGKAVDYVETYGGWVWMVGLVAGVGAMIRRRPQGLGFLVLPAVLIYGLFYAYYEYFVPRYYFVVVLHLAVLSGVGWVALGGLIGRWRVGKALVGVALMVGMWPFVQTRVFTQSDSFRLADAHALSEVLSPYVDDRSLVLCERNLCEVLDWFTPAQSLSVHRFSRKGKFDADLGMNVRALIQARLDQGDKVYHIAPPSVPRGRHDTEHLLRFFDLVQLKSWSSEAFQLGSLWKGEWALYEVVPWTRRTVELVLDVPENPMPLVRVDIGGTPDQKAANREVRLDGKVLPLNEAFESRFALLPLAPASETVRLEVKSDGLLPERIYGEVFSYAKPIRLDYGTCHFPRNREAFTGDFEKAEYQRETMVRAADWGAVALPPLPKREGHVWLVGAELGAGYSAGPVEVDVSIGGGHRRQVAIPTDRQFHLVYLGAVGEAEEERSLQVRFDLFGSTQPDFRGRIPQAFVRRVLLYSVPLAEVRRIDIGSGQDRIRYIGDGFYRGMRRPDRSAVRWTNGRARCWVYPNRSEDLQVHVTLADGGRPEEAPDADVWFEWNGTRVDVGEPVSESPESIFKTFSFRVKADQVVLGANALDLCSTVWQPSEWNTSSDQRRLGVMVKEVRWGPPEAGQRTGTPD